jgi:hypothetical protein
MRNSSVKAEQRPYGITDCGLAASTFPGIFSVLFRAAPVLWLGISHLYFTSGTPVILGFMPYSSKGSVALTGGLIAICIFWFAATSIHDWLVPGSGMFQASEAESEGARNSYIACAAAQGTIAGRLTAPSTAKFPSCLLGDVAVTQNPEKDLWRVDSYVDAQNAFGAMVRTRFSCNVPRGSTAESTSASCRYLR